MLSDHQNVGFIEISRSDTTESGENEATVTSELHAQEYRSTLKNHRRHAIGRERTSVCIEIPRHDDDV